MLQRLMLQFVMVMVIVTVMLLVVVVLMLVLMLMLLLLVLLLLSANTWARSGAGRSAEGRRRVGVAVGHFQQAAGGVHRVRF